MIRLGIVDDHPVFRMGLIRIFERERDLSVVWELSTLDELTAMLDRYPVDVILMDLSLGPDQDALAATRLVRDAHQEVKVIIVSASLDWEAAMAARGAGASGYLPKDLSIADMVETIRALASPGLGRPNFTDMLEARPKNGNSGTQLWQELTRREQEVLGELRRGHTNREIAALLGVSIPTVNKHVQQVLRKLQVHTRAQAIAMVAAVSTNASYRGARTARRGNDQTAAKRHKLVTTDH